MSKELIGGRFRIAQLFHVGDVTASFNRKSELRRNNVMPELESLRAWQMIEGVIDFDGAEMLNVMVQHLIVVDIFRVKMSPPVCVVPP